MKQPNNGKQNFTPSEKRAIVIVASLLSVGAIVVLVLLVILLRQRAGQQPTQAAETLPPPLAPTVFVPTVVCGSPNLVLGQTTFQIQNISPAPDGTLAVLPDGPGIAYWLAGTDGNYLIILSPTPDNLSLLSTLTAGNTAKATWADCSSLTYSLSAPEPGTINISTLLSQLTSGLTIFFQTDASGNGSIIRGDLAEMIFP